MPHPSLITMSIIISIVSLVLIIMYFANKNFRSFALYFNIVFAITIALDNLVRLLPAGNNETKTLACYIQAFCLTIFDKLMLTLMTAYSIIAYLGSFQMHFYKSYEKLIFIVSIVISIFISLIITFLFYTQGISNRSEYCYVETYSKFKQIIDSIVTSVLLIISLLCIIKILMKIQQIRKERQAENQNEKEKKTLNAHFCRFIFNFILNFLTFTYVLLLINKLLPTGFGFAKDLIFILISLFIELFYTINLELIKEIKRIITCNNIQEDDPDNVNFSENLDEE